MSGNDENGTPESLRRMVDDIESTTMKRTMRMKGFPKKFYEEVDEYILKEWGDNRFTFFRHMWEWYHHDKKMNERLDALEKRMSKMEGEKKDGKDNASIRKNA